MSKTQSSKKHRIAAELLIWFMFVAFLSLAVVGFVTYRVSREALEKSEKSNLVAILGSKINRVEGYVRERERDVATLARNPTIVKAMAEFDVAFQEGGIDSSEYVTVDERYGPFLRYYQEAFGYSDLFLISPSGDSVFSVMRGEDLGSNYYTGPYKNTQLAKVVDRARTLLGTEVSDFAYYPATNEPAAFIAAPIFGEGALIGVIVLQMSNREVYDLAQDWTGLGDTGETIIASRKGERAVFVTPVRHDPHAAFRRRITIGSDEAIPVQEAVEGKKGTGVFVDFRDKEVLAAWRYSPHLRWGVVVKTDTAEAFAPIVTLRNRVVGVGVGILLAVVLASFLVSNSISRPITKLTQITRMIAGGDLTKRADISSSNEIGQLADSFNEMTARLRESYSDLRQTVAEREKINQDLTSEITERKRAEERAQHLNALLRSIRNVNQLIATEKDRDRLLQGACKGLNETRGYHSIWMMFLDESRELTTTAEVGIGEDFLSLVDRVGRGDWTHCARRAMSQPGVLVIDDPASTCGDCPIAKGCCSRKAMAVRLE